ncbi:CoA transferase [Pinirhizobacter soli]|uniref:CoA transferase n=1 Tax=Pinirhizobacter soli TaxID=2786953 RepID=UPI00202A60B3|nr:CoA transferase [Pinirhizobacter soli]
MSVSQQPAHTMLSSAWSALGGDPATLDAAAFVEVGALPAFFPVTDLASATMAAAGLAISELRNHASSASPAAVTVDRRLASMWFHWSQRPIGWTPPAPWDPIAGDYLASDGWIRLHTNAPHHRKAAERILGEHQDKAGMAKAVGAWKKAELEHAIVDVGGCAAEMRSLISWADHPQGIAVASEPLIHRQPMQDENRSSWRPDTTRPLHGLRVLDLTRVLAGPAATRFLAAYGADVLRIDPPTWDEPGLSTDLTLGKRCARLDLRKQDDRAIFENLLSTTDILVHGYRPDALERLGFGVEARRRLAPGLIDVCLDAYGWTGPWAGRRGFDSLVQMSTGIADAGMQASGADKPKPLPVQALDHGTGYLMAAAAVRGITERLKTGRGMQARLSLARTAKFLPDHATPNDTTPIAAETPADLDPWPEHTTWGEARRVRWPVAMDGCEAKWNYAASPLGSSPAEWV